MRTTEVRYIIEPNFEIKLMSGSRIKLLYYACPRAICTCGGGRARRLAVGFISYFFEFSAGMQRTLTYTVHVASFGPVNSVISG